MTLATVTASQRHALVQIQGLNVYWHTMTGGGRVVNVTEDPDDPTGDPLIGVVAAEDIELTTDFSPRDMDWVRDLKRSVGDGGFTVVRQWTDENWSHIGEPEVYPDCILIGYSNPTSSPTTEAATISVTLATKGEAL